jgi:hypothetical protein
VKSSFIQSGSVILLVIVTAFLAFSKYVHRNLLEKRGEAETVV